jgi:Flp pilus assembly pilin Flp
MEKINEKMRAAIAKSQCVLHAGWKDRRGQGTTEYAILVGVLVVIAILAITVFRPKIQELWDAISNGINGL